MALIVTSYSLVYLKSYFNDPEMALKVTFTISLSFSFYSLSLFTQFHLRHSGDGADFHIFNLSLSFSRYIVFLV